jgi:hypothetical protein
MTVPWASGRAAADHLSKCCSVDPVQRPVIMGAACCIRRCVCVTLCAHHSQCACQLKFTRTCSLATAASHDPAPLEPAS